MVADIRKNKRNSMDNILIGERLCVGPVQVKDGVFHFFKSHFQKKVNNKSRLDGLPINQISASANCSMEEIFSLDEVWSALCECDGNKALGPDGLNLNFIRSNWDAIKRDFIQFMEEFYSDGSVVKHLKSIFVALVSKLRNLLSSKDYRPIGLVGAAYKILAKVFANRLNRVMDTVINPSQVAFLKVLVNGSQTKEFQVERGLRQGDLLSPFMFNLVVEVLRCMFVKPSEKGLIKGVCFKNEGFQLTRLQLADDTILFIEPCMDYLLNAKRILRCFELVSELKINFHKSYLVKVGKKHLDEEVWAHAFRCVSASLSIMYLGMPLSGNLKREALWSPIVKKVEDILYPWNRGRIKDKGVSFSAKWNWHFGREHSSLWKMVICYKYGWRVDGLVWDSVEQKTFSSFMKSVCRLFDPRSVSSPTIKKGFHVVIGSRQRSRF
ncbi:hypothetical protein Ddye_024751 [Dipteronia dyeriana]|uniref:Reverse transcriptase domain-containing protein n=1 Tax=Dipteronia dyeriana TaxID=168575 RepID=A0AAD9TW21_9ROSI|nr:hypothetical protein Ddye_024751 [Dipteronia dyeriana]